MTPNHKMKGREKYARVSTSPAVVNTTEKVTKATARLYMGLGTVPCQDARETPTPIPAPTVSITIIGQIEAPPSRGTVQNNVVPNTRTDAVNNAITKAAMSEIRIDRRNLRPMKYQTTVHSQVRVLWGAVASIFTAIINGDLPGRFVYRDDLCVAFLTIEPVTAGHTLVVPIEEVDHWIDLDEMTAAHLFVVAQRIGKALSDVFEPAKIALIIAGLEVPHTHLHVIPIESESDLDFSKADRSPDPEALDGAAARISRAIEG